MNEQNSLSTKIQSTDEEDISILGKSSREFGDHVRVVVTQDFTEYEVDTDSKVRFLRVEVSNTEPAVRSIIEAIADTSWVSSLVDDLIKQSFLKCAEPTIKKLSYDLNKAIDSGVTDTIGEYVVSMVARYIIEATYNYRALPLAEVIKEKVSGNPGFDYHHENNGLVLLFGEAKYITGQNAYNSAFKQVCDFIKDGKDLKEAASLSHFMTDDAKTNLSNGRKGYSAAFSTKSSSFDSAMLIDNIKRNTHFNNLLEHEELLIIAVDIHG
jgi:citrate lyase gamma subunit